MTQPNGRWEAWWLKVVGGAVGLVVTAIVGANTDILRQLPRALPKVPELESHLGELQRRLVELESWQRAHQEFAATRSAELQQRVERNTQEIDRLRELVERELYRRRPPPR